MQPILYAHSADEQFQEILAEKNYVQSIFEHGINIKAKSRLLFIGTSERGELPYAIHLERPELKKLQGIRLGDPFFYKTSGYAFVGSSYVIDVTRARRYSSLLSAVELVGIRELLYLLEEILMRNDWTGFDLFTRHLLFEDPSFVSGLREACTTENPEEIDSALRKVMGRGKGLTPSGDDLLLGMLWVNALRKFLHAEFLDRLQLLVQKDDLTTQVSKSYLQSALEGRYHALLLSLAQALVNKDSSQMSANVVKLKKIGHTSGADMLSGIALGIDILLNQ